MASYKNPKFKTMDDTIVKIAKGLTSTHQRYYPFKND